MTDAETEAATTAQFQPRREPVTSDSEPPLRLTWLGHATMLIELEGARVMTDPVLRPWIGPLRRRGGLWHPSWLQGLDAVLISHTHLDHLDMGSLALFPRTTRLFLPYGTARIVRRLGFSHIVELHAGDTNRIGPLSIAAIQARHSSIRVPLGEEVESLGFGIAGKARNLYFAGDTAIFPEMAVLSSRLDVALLPVWGWGPRLGSEHMDPLQAAQALQLLRPRVAIPIHWGTLYPPGVGWLRARYLRAPPVAFSGHAARLAPEVEVRVLAPGCATRV
jgi:L-ascorbate metabolism protein UlaG (beta-lactamase superfamily)